MVRVLKKVIIPVYIALEMLKFFIYVLLQNVWNHNKITFLKKASSIRAQRRSSKKNSCTKY